MDKKMIDYRIPAKKKKARIKTAQEIKIDKLEDKLNHICNLIDLEWNGSITRAEMLKRVTEICSKDSKVIEINSIRYRVTDEYNDLASGTCYYLESLQYDNDDWVQVSDLTELKIWEYNKLVDELHKHYPDYPIEHLEGRFA